MSWRSGIWRSRQLCWAALGLLALALTPLVASAQHHLGIPGAAEPELLPAALAAQQPDPSVPPPAEPVPVPEIPGPLAGGSVLAPLPAPLVKAGSAVVVDAQTGQVIWERNAHVRRPIASTTKIMTATLLIESGRLDDTVTFSDHARATPYQNLNAKAGERFKLLDLLYAIMMRSSNDSCVAAAEHVSGQAWRFTAQMTLRARELGATDTNFVTTNGLYHPQHYSTAFDLALLTRHAMQYPLFNQVVATRERYINRSINQKDTLIRNHNKFLAKYLGADGVKTGYVKEAGRCLVASATRREQGQPWRLITVVLHSTDTYGDSQRLQDWTRKYFQPIFVARQGEDSGTLAVRGGSSGHLPVAAAADLRAVVRRDLLAGLEKQLLPHDELRAPIDAQQVVGRLVVRSEGRELGSVNVLATRSVQQTWLAAGITPWGGFSLFVAGLLLLRRLPRRAWALARRGTGGAARRRS